MAKAKRGRMVWKIGDCNKCANAPATEGFKTCKPCRVKHRNMMRKWGGHNERTAKTKKPTLNDLIMYECAVCHKESQGVKSGWIQWGDDYFCSDDCYQSFKKATR